MEKHKFQSVVSKDGEEIISRIVIWECRETDRGVIYIPSVRLSRRGQEKEQKFYVFYIKPVLMYGKMRGYILDFYLWHFGNSYEKIIKDFLH